MVDFGGNYLDIRNTYPNDRFAKTYTFNSARKMMSTIIEANDQSGYKLFSKGASEMVLSKCGYYLKEDGTPVKMSSEKISNLIKNVVERMASDGLRTICVASREFLPKSEQSNKINAKYYDDDSVPDWVDEPNIITDLTCLALIGIQDPGYIDFI